MNVNIVTTIPANVIPDPNVRIMQQLQEHSWVRQVGLQEVDSAAEGSAAAALAADSPVAAASPPAGKSGLPPSVPLKKL